ncbi:hypothetical protein GCM10023264_11480 [Sphingomonas daechungensis]|uniref:PAS domain-containing protein n=1 Tax=Sphingomonas daechungensis TaxID=1176646 RepID=A0ABX6T3T1_9SPHN|nr:hypothetical protein [Sphingomonas daechungensis]QNP42416.1 hypothetical protein H9L15_08820 [Sphingomonas daechungensis]QNP44557.1 hypothetical protein H9L15_15790 [Sphingomonas daechungensis]
MDLAGLNKEDVHPRRLKQVWPALALSRHVDLASLLNCAAIDAVSPSVVGAVSNHHVGAFQCDLENNALTWSGGVYDIFGFARGQAVSRAQCVACYTGQSRFELERLRSYAIDHRQGFSLDVEIRAAVGETRRVRLVAAPHCEDGRAKILSGIKILLP